MTEKLIEFFTSRPDIPEKFKFDGTFKDYAIEIEKSVASIKGKSPLTQKIMHEAERLLSKEFSLEPLRSQLLIHPLISYADHHGLLNFKLLYNSNLLYYLIIKELRLPFIMVLATGNIPLKNISYPRGFYFNGSKYNFFLNKMRDVPVYLIAEKLFADRDFGLERLILNYNKEMLCSEKRKFLECLFFDCLEIERAAKEYEVFSDQITFLNYKLWKYYFDISLRNSVPNMIYLQSNQIIQSILLDELKKKDSLISTILLDPKARKIYLENFYGLHCCWGENIGSHFFWGITEKKKYIALHIDEPTNSLKGDNFNLILEREAIIDALYSKKILPTIFFDFLIVTFLEGYLALGGMNQVEFLPKMQKAHIKSLEEIGMKDLAKKFSKPIAHGLICGMYPLDFDSGIDLIWHYNSTNGKFNGNMDGGLSQEDLDKVSNTLLTELISTGIDQTLEMFE